MEPDFKPIYVDTGDAKMKDFGEDGFGDGIEKWEDSKAGKGRGILVRTSYVVERSSPRFPVKVFSPRRWAADRHSSRMGEGRGGGPAFIIGGRNVLKAQPMLNGMEARSPVLTGRRMSFWRC